MNHNEISLGRKALKPEQQSRPNCIPLLNPTFLPSLCLTLILRSNGIGFSWPTMFLRRAFRTIAPPLSQAYSLSRSPLPPPPGGILPTSSGFGSESSSILARFCSSSTLVSADFSRLTESRFPKRRPGLKNRKKRASLRPSGPYAWVKYVPGEPIQPSQLNEGSIKARGRNEKKRIKLHKAFVLSEKKKRMVQWAAARKRKEAARIERKMAQVAREKEWAERLVELQQLEQAKKSAASTA